MLRQVYRAVAETLTLPSDYIDQTIPDMIAEPGILRPGALLRPIGHMVLDFVRSGMTPEQIEAGVELYESLFDIAEL